MTPLTVVAGWILDRDMTLSTFFEMTTFIGAMLLVNFSILNGKTSYLEGLMCFFTP